MNNIKMKLQGEYHLQAHTLDENGEIVNTRELGKFPNLITNQGLDRIANSYWTGYASVGSGNTPPNNTDTGLTAPIAFTGTVQASSSGSAGAAPYYSYFNITYRFAAGVAAGNLSEVGIGWGNANNALFSHALILDGSGNPTTITVLGTEVLDVSYQLKLIVPTADVSGSVTISGVSYTTVVRAADAASWPNPQNQFSITGVLSAVYNGGLGPITGTPTGSSAGTSLDLAYGSYSAGSYTLPFSASLGLNDGNVSGGISASFILTGAGIFQVSFSPAIPKDATKTLTLNGSISWARD